MSVKKIAVAIVSFTLAAWFLILYWEHTPEEISFYQQNDTIYIHQSDSIRLNREVLLKQDDGFRNTETEDCDPYSQIAACEGFALYAHQGKDVGIIFLLNGHAQYFDWQYQTPRQIAPRAAMLNDDFYACILNTASGTGIQLYELHLLSLKNNQISDTCLTSESLSRTFENVLTNVELSEQTLAFQLDGQPIRLHFSEYEEPLTLTSVSCGQSVNEILFENGLTTHAALELHTKELFGPIFAGTLQAKIRYENGIFQFTDFSIISE